MKLIHSLKDTSSRSVNPLSFDDWAQSLTMNRLLWEQSLSNPTLGEKQEEISSTFVGYVEQAYKANGIVFACMLTRLLLFSEARFQFRRMRDGRPGELFGTDALSILEKPWHGATTGDLLTRTLQDGDLAGNFFGVHRGDRIQRLRPDWVTIILGSHDEPNADTGMGDLDVEVMGYAYQPGGKHGGKEVIALDRDDVVHFAPIPDPLATFRGMSWLTPVVREIMGDQAATTHKLKFFENGASPNLVVSFDSDLSPESMEKWLEAFDKNHEGAANAYKTLILAAGARAEVIGSDLKQVDFKQVQGAGETRIAAAAGVPPVIVGLSEGLEASTYCLPADERVWTLDGPRPIVDVRPGDELWSTGEGTVRRGRVTWQGCVGEKDVYRVKTKNRELRATANHPVLVRVPGNSDGPNSERGATTEWREVGELRPGDKIIQAVGLPDAGENPKGISPDMAQWLGAYVGDGCSAGKTAIQMSLPPTDRTRLYYEDLSVRLFGARIAAGERSFRLAGCHASSIVADLGFAGTAKTKRIPGWVFRLPLALRLRFLAGLVDTDGSVDKRGVGSLGFANRELVEQARALFVSCGIAVSNVTYREQSGENLPNPGRYESYDFWSFAITTGLGKVPTADPLYLERIKARNDKPEGAHERNPSLDADVLGAFKIISIELIDRQPVYDITVEGDHSFIAAGVAVHNSNYAQARRRFADGTLRPLWRNMAGSFATMIDVPSGAELWYDDRDIAFLQEDRQDAAKIQQAEAATIKTLIEAGYEPDSVIEAVNAEDMTRLVHSGLVSIQLQPPGSVNGGSPSPAAPPDA
jgi:hypothetical protein